MSRCLKSGLKAEPEVLPAERDAFVAEIFDQWAGGDPHKLRRLAIGYLASSGWKQAMIAGALKMEQGAVSRQLDQLRREFAAAYAPPEALSGAR